MNVFVVADHGDYLVGERGKIGKEIYAKIVRWQVFLGDFATEMK